MRLSRAPFNGAQMAAGPLIASQIKGEYGFPVAILEPMGVGGWWGGKGRFPNTPCDPLQRSAGRHGVFSKILTDRLPFRTA